MYNIFPPSWTSLPPTPSHSSRSSEHGAELLMLYSSFPLVTCFTHGRVYMAVPLSQFVPASPSPNCTHKSILCLPLHCCPAVEVHHSTGVCMEIPYTCLHIQYLSFSFWLTPLCITGSRFVHITRTDSNAFLFIAVTQLLLSYFWPFSFFKKTIN